MINQIFIDLDETLIHTHNESYITHDFTITLDDSLWGNVVTYKVKVNPASKDVIDYARELVGEENVFILTASIFDYACDINEKAGFGFSLDNIISREKIAALLKHKAKTFHNKNNVLIDNLDYRYNEDKCELIGVNWSQYLKVKDYYGIGEDQTVFKNDCIEFLDSFYNESEEL